MRLKTANVMWVGGAAAVAFIVSTLTVLGESRLRPTGSFRVVMTGGSPLVTLPHMATFMPDGGIVGSVIPVSCLGPDQLMSESHGEWTVSMRRGVPMLHFHLQADLYTRPKPQVTGQATDTALAAAAGDPEATTYDGFVSVVGSAPLTFGSIKGTAMMTFPPGPCAERYNGKVEFTATEIEAVPPTKQ